MSLLPDEVTYLVRLTFAAKKVADDPENGRALAKEHAASSVLGEGLRLPRLTMTDVILAASVYRKQELGREEPFVDYKGEPMGPERRKRMEEILAEPQAQELFSYLDGLKNALLPRFGISR